MTRSRCDGTRLEFPAAVGKWDVSKCPYCGEDFTDLSNDHIFPRFLGGERTIVACRSCNSKFGHTFEGDAAEILERMYVQLAIWGVPLPVRDRWWRSAYEVEGATLDLRVGREGIHARSNRPIIQKDEAGAVVAAYFERERDLEQFERVSSQRKPGAQWVRDDKRIATNLKGLRWSLQLGPCLQQMALKMSLAASTLLANLGHHDCAAARRSLSQMPSGAHDCVAQYMHSVDEIAAMAPALAHTIYVEHCGYLARGLVVFFGAFPLFVELSARSEVPGDNAVLGYLDPIEAHEHFEIVVPFGLQVPPPFYTGEGILQHQINMVQRFVQNAQTCGATVNPERRPDRPVSR